MTTIKHSVFVSAPQMTLYLDGNINFKKVRLLNSQYVNDANNYRYFTLEINGWNQNTHHDPVIGPKEIFTQVACVPGNGTITLYQALNESWDYVSHQTHEQVNTLVITIRQNGALPTITTPIYLCFEFSR